MVQPCFAVRRIALSRCGGVRCSRDSWREANQTVQHSGTIVPAKLTMREAGILWGGINDTLCVNRQLVYRMLQSFSAARRLAQVRTPLSATRGTVKCFHFNSCFRRTVR